MAVSFFLLSSLMFLIIGRSSAETIGHMLQTRCVDGGRIIEVDSRARESAALLDDRNSATFNKDLARLYFRCSVQTSDGYVRDWARYFYVISLTASGENTEDDLRSMHAGIQILNDLAASSIHSDVRDASLKARRTTKRQYVDLYKLHFGSAPNDVAIESVISASPSIAKGSTITRQAENPNLNRGKLAYDDNCQSCHGATGVRGTGGSLLNLALSIDDIKQIILVPPSSMPRLYPQKLTEDDVDAVARYIVLKLQEVQK